jgi:hypothetical protein
MKGLNMTKRTLTTILLVIGFSLCPVCGIGYAGLAAHQKTQPRDPSKTPFRYVIIRDKILEGRTYPEGGKWRVRGVDVLLDPKSFSESTLRQLAELLSKRFPAQDDLDVNIYTNLEDTLTPEEAEQVAPSTVVEVPTGSPLGFPLPKYAWARFVRKSEGETLEYDTKEPGDVFKTIELRGKKISGSGK